MSPLNFCYWLQGVFELAAAGGSDFSLSDAQGRVIAEHLGLVFKGETEGSRELTRKVSPFGPPEIHDYKWSQTVQADWGEIFRKGPTCGVTVEYGPAGSC